VEAHIPVIALSGLVFESHRTRAWLAGFDRVLFKPCYPQALVEQIRAVLTRPPATTMLVSVRRGSRSGLCVDSNVPIADREPRQTPTGPTDD
jgi:DNA-binding response OmpR family regulator